MVSGQRDENPVSKSNTKEEEPVMNNVVLGRTGIEVRKQSFGCLPIQRLSKAEAVKLLRQAAEGGMNFFDTARAYTDSEEKVGEAFKGIRHKLIIATKTGAQTAEEMWKDLETSLKNLQTDYIDIYQFHNPSFCPKPGGADGLYEAALKAREQGKIHIQDVDTVSSFCVYGQLGVLLDQKIPARERVNRICSFLREFIKCFSS